MPILAMVVVSALAGQGCASQDPAARAAEQASMDSSEDDAACRAEGAPGTPTYDDCRAGLAEKRAQQGAIQEQKRRDFDRVLGAGTSGADESY